MLPIPFIAMALSNTELAGQLRVDYQFPVSQTYSPIPCCSPEWRDYPKKRIKYNCDRGALQLTIQPYSLVIASINPCVFSWLNCEYFCFIQRVAWYHGHSLFLDSKALKNIKVIDKVFFGSERHNYTIVNTPSHPPFYSISCMDE